jgi:hypothetical protein
MTPHGVASCMRQASAADLLSQGQAVQEPAVDADATTSQASVGVSADWPADATYSSDTAMTIRCTQPEYDGNDRAMGVPAQDPPTTA